MAVPAGGSNPAEASAAGVGSTTTAGRRSYSSIGTQRTLLRFLFDLGVALASAGVGPFIISDTAFAMIASLAHLSRISATFARKNAFTVAVLSKPSTSPRKTSMTPGRSPPALAAASPLTGVLRLT